MADTFADDAMKLFLAQRWWALLLRGVFAIIFGIICFANPALAAVTLVIWFGIFSIVDGIAGLVASFGQARNGGRWAWLAFEAVASIVIGVIVLMMPGLSLIVLFFIIAIKAAVTGIFLLIASVKLDGESGQGWLAAGGIVSVLFAAALFLAPLAGARILIWWIGLWAVAFGILLSVLSFKLKGAQKKVAAFAETRG